MTNLKICDTTAFEYYRSYTNGGECPIHSNTLVATIECPSSGHGVVRNIKDTAAACWA